MTGGPYVKQQGFGGPYVIPAAVEGRPYPDEFTAARAAAMRSSANDVPEPELEFEPEPEPVGPYGVGGSRQ